jgi:hypothetical protein
MFPEITGALVAVVLTLSPAQAARSVEGGAVVTSRADRHEPYRLFGGRTAMVPVRVHAPDPDGLDLRAVLVQLTSSLSVPVAEQLAVRLSPRADGDPWFDAEFGLTPPDVKRETDFEIRFRSRRRGEPAWQAAGRVTVRVYPSDLLDPVRAWARSHPLSVQDHRGLLVEFLRRQTIPIADRPGGRGVTLYVASRRKDGSVPLLDGGAAVLFTERETDTPHLVIDRTGRTTIVRVETRFLDRLETDPQAQKLLLEVFQRLHEQLTPVEGVDR